ncbi:MAG TPA: secretin N-terminal domain-containing protein [Steroidobacteraceae bacterium]|nr:secretin N-terminal domain-containing protein [Steroidobacteraceae bacterium]
MNFSLSRMGVALAAAVLLASCASSRVHQQGLDDFDQGQYEVGLQKLQRAVASDPGNLGYRLDLNSRHDQAVQKLIAEADRARAAGDATAAEATYHRVLAIENGNDRATRGLQGVADDMRHAQRVNEAQADLQGGEFDQASALLRSVLTEDPGYAPAVALRARLDAARGPVTVTPRLRTRDNRPVTLQFRDAQTKMVFEVLSRQTGINFIFDKDVKSDSKTTIFVADVPIEQAIDLVLGQSQLARQVLSENMVLIYPNTDAKQKDYQDQIVRTFYLNTAAPKDVESLLKTVLDAKTLVINERANAIIMRDAPEVVRMAEKLVASVDLVEPEVMLEVEVLEITRTRMQQLGITYPSSAKLSMPSGLVVNDLSKQNGSTISVSSLSVTLDALKTTGNSNVLASPRIRARNKEKAKILIGSRVPVITTAVSSAGIGQTSIANTQVQYLDVGLTLDVEPTIYADNDVAIKLQLEVSSIVNTINVGDTRAYEIGTRNVSTLLQLKDGETQILAGLIKDSDTHSASKVPGLGDIPIVGRLFSDHNTDKEKTEVVLSITPRIIRAKPRPSSDTTEFWFGTQSRSGLAPLGAAPAVLSVPAGGAGAAAPGPSGPPAPAGAASVPALGAPATPAPSVAAPVERTPVNVDTTGAGAASGAVTGMPGGGGAPAAAPSARLAALQGITDVPSAKGSESDGPPPHPTATILGPSEVKVGDEFTVTLQMQTDQGVGRVRAQLRFDSSAFQLQAGDPGSMVPGSLGAKVIGRPGGAQIDVTSTDQPLTGSGDLIVLKLKALQARPKTAIAAQVSAMGSSGVIVGSATPTPLTISVSD